MWWRDNGSGQKDLYGRQLGGNGQLLDNAFTILEQEDVQDKLAVIGAGGGWYLLAWQDDRNGTWDIYAPLAAADLPERATLVPLLPHPHPHRTAVRFYGRSPLQDSPISANESAAYYRPQ